jgi:hypothetical protein
LRFALPHGVAGYELRGSGSNNYTKYLARSLARAGNEVHIICRDSQPSDYRPWLGECYRYSADGSRVSLWEADPDLGDASAMASGGSATMHVLPLGRLAPVYQTDMKHPGIVKPFRDISDSELEEYTALASSVVAKILASTGLDLLHCNHMAMQPTIARVACAQLAATTGACATQFVVFPHGSAIEFTLRPDERYRALALEAILSPHCAGMISGNHEVLNRILRIFPESAGAIVAKTRIVGVGTDTTLFQVSVLLCTVTFYANLAHSLTRSP